MRPPREAAPRPWTAAFTHEGPRSAHVFLDGDEVTGITDRSESSRGDAVHDLATVVRCAEFG